MPTHIGIGFSQNSDVTEAAKNAAFASKTQLGQDRIDLAIVLHTTHYNPQFVLPVMRKILNNARLIGSSTSSIILSNGIHPKGIAVLTFQSDEIFIGASAVDNLSALSITQSSSMLLKKCLEEFGQHQRHAFLLLSDSSNENTAFLIKSLHQSLGNLIPIIGGCTAHEEKTANTAQLYNQHILNKSALSLLIGGQATVGVGGRHGWKPLGKPRFITRARGNTIISIDNKKANHLFEEYLSHDILNMSKQQFQHMAMLYPLGLKISGSDEYLIRTAIDLTKEGSIICHGDIPEGVEVHMMIGNKDFCKTAAQKAAEEASHYLLGKKAKVVFVFASNARLKLFGRAAHQEILPLKNIFGAETPIFGMFTNGEIYPFQKQDLYKTPRLQNNSFVIAAIS